MKTYPTFCDGNFHDFSTIKEANALKDEAYKLAAEKQRSKNADHMIYGYTSYKTNGEIDTFHFYSGLAKTEAEFKEISKIPNSQIYAIHRK